MSIVLSDPRPPQGRTRRPNRISGPKKRDRASDFQWVSRRRGTTAGLSEA